MKHLMKTLCAAAAVMALAACSEDQTEFNVDSIPGRAQVKGTIVYNQGTTIENGRFVYNYKPLASHEVILSVPNSYYKSGSAGEKIYTAKTDAEGHYSFDIPATNSTGTATVSIRPFEGTTTNIKVVNNKPAAVEEPVVWRSSETVSISARDLRIVNMDCGYNSFSEVPESFSKQLTYKLTLGENFEYKINATPRYGSNSSTIVGYNPAEVKRLWKPAANADFVVQFGNSNVAINMFGTTDANGVCTLKVPAKDVPVTYNVSIAPVSKLGSFTHYVETTVEKTLTSGSKVKVRDYEAKKLDGWYQAANESAEYFTFEFESITMNDYYKCLYFTPLPGTDTDYSQSAWNGNEPWLEDFLKDQEKGK